MLAGEHSRILVGECADFGAVRSRILYVARILKDARP
jgi:hypothetical protein